MSVRPEHIVPVAEVVTAQNGGSARLSGKDNDSIVVVGSGLSGYTLVRQLRQHDRERPVTIITLDGGEVYSKPLLSNALAKGQTPETMVQKAGPEKATELGVNLITNCRVRDIDVAARRLSTDCGELGYHKLVLATGAYQRVILPEAADSAWIDTVNSLDDYRRWYGKLQGTVERVLLIGAGLIGCEFADDLMSRGINVDLVDPAPWPLSRLLPESIGVALAQAFERSGARLHMGCQVARLERNSGGGFDAMLDDGTTVRSDLVLSAVGLVSETDLARSAGLKVGQGVLVDRQLRASDPNIHAIGDCAETDAGVLPYILPLMAKAKVLGEILAGREAHLSMKAMPVVVKTTSLPLVVCPPRRDTRGTWRVQGEAPDLSAVFHDENGAPAGFALAGTALTQKMQLGRVMPPLLGPVDH